MYFWNPGVHYERPCIKSKRFLPKFKFNVVHFPCNWSLRMLLPCSKWSIETHQSAGNHFPHYALSHICRLLSDHTHTHTHTRWFWLNKPRPPSNSLSTLIQTYVCLVKQLYNRHRSVYSRSIGLFTVTDTTGCGIFQDYNICYTLPVILTNKIFVNKLKNANIIPLKTSIINWWLDIDYTQCGATVLGLIFFNRRHEVKKHFFFKFKISSIGIYAGFCVVVQFLKRYRKFFFLDQVYTAQIIKYILPK
jgi:hypothetical protein